MLPRLRLHHLRRPPPVNPLDQYRSHYEHPDYTPGAPVSTPAAPSKEEVAQKAIDRFIDDVLVAVKASPNYGSRVDEIASLVKSVLAL